MIFKSKMKRVLQDFAAVSLLFFLAAGPMGAQDLSPEDISRPLTSGDAVACGLVRNRSYLAAKQEVEAFKQKIKEAKADFFPRLDASYSFKHLKDQPYAEYISTRIFTSPNNVNHWEIDLSQPLFTGFGLTAQLNISKLDAIVAEQKLEETRLNLVRDIQHAFWQTLLAGRLLQVARDSIESLEVHRRNADAYFQQGVVVKNDVLKAEVALSQARQNERKASKQLVVLRSRLNQLLDRDLQARIDLTEGDMQPRTPPDLTGLYDRAEEQRPERLAVKTTLRQIDESIRAARSKYYPQFKAFALYYREGSDFFAEHNDYTNPDQTAVGLRMDWNLFEGGKTDATVKEFLYKKRSYEERERDVVQQIRLQVEDAYEQMLVARDNIDTARTALKQAEENERMTTLQYKQQIVIFLEVLNAQVFVTQTRVDYNQALYGYQLACADLERAVGGPLDDR